MRRALALVVVLLAGMLVAASALAATPAVEEDVEDVHFLLRAHGFTVSVTGEDNDGDVSASLSIGRGGQFAYYRVPAKLTDESVTARFGRLGELSFRFAKVPPGGSDCRGEAEFAGRFDFTGEGGFLHIDADRTLGSVGTFYPVGCGRWRLPGSAIPVRSAVAAEGVTLEAVAGTRRHGRQLMVVGDGRKALVSAIRAEVRGRMTVARGVQAAAGAGAFRSDLVLGTATLRPPAPFTGSAIFIRHGGNGRGNWKGSLRMPILGGEPVALAGPEFGASIHKGVPQGE